MIDLKQVKALLNKKNPAITKTSKPKDSYNKAGEIIKYKALNRPKDFHILKIAKPLFDYQLDGVYFIDRQKGRAILGDDMGLGKTAQSLGYLQLHPNDRLVLVVCPATLKLNWAKETFMWLERREENRVYVVSGKIKKSIQEVYLSGSGDLKFQEIKNIPKTGIIIINYDILFDWHLVLKAAGIKILILDEVQAIKSIKATRTKATIKLSKNIPKVIAVTGTLIENRPIDAYNAINIVEPNLFPSRWEFAKRYCDLKANGFGMTKNGATNIPELFQKLSAIMIRRLKGDVLKDLPRLIRTAIPLEIDNMNVYKAIKADRTLDHLSRSEKLSQTAALGKLEAALNWIEDYLESGLKLVVFANHRKIVDLVYEEFKDNTVRIYGGMSLNERNKAVEEFQNNPKIKLLSGNIIAAGTGLTLTAASATATIEILSHSPAKHLQAEDRVNRIGQLADCIFAYYFVGINTCDEDNLKELEAKSKIIDQALDGVEENETSIFNDLIGV